MLYKNSFLQLIGLAVAVTSANAVLVNSNNLGTPTGNFTPFVDPILNDFYASGGSGFIQLGYFNGTDFSAITADGAIDQVELAGLIADFTQFGTTTLGFGDNTGADLAGFYSGEFDGQILDGSLLDGRNIQLVAGDGTGFADSTSLIVVESSNLYPNDLLPGANSTFVLDADLAVTRIGTSRSILFPGVGDLNGIQGLRIVPEPSGAILLGIALATLGLRRRKGSMKAF